LWLRRLPDSWNQDTRPTKSHHARGVPRLARPSCAIGLALLVLAWVERDRALVVLALGYLAVLLVPITFGWVLRGWTFLPQFLIDGSILLLGGIGFALAQRPWRRAA
jgi:hypothetical protein